MVFALRGWRQSVFFFTLILVFKFISPKKNPESNFASSVGDRPLSSQDGLVGSAWNDVSEEPIHNKDDAP